MNSAAVMVVDDDYDIRSALQEVLEEEGYAVTTAADGADALDQLRRGVRPTVILLDLMMPVMDGFAFCQEWNKDAALSTIPVVVISADAAIAQKTARCRANAYLEKPIRLPDLLRAVGAFAAAHGSSTP